MTDDFDPNKIASDIATDLIKSSMKGIVGSIKNFFDEKLLKKTLKTYLKHVNLQYNSVRVLGATKSIPLDKIFTEINFLKEIPSRRLKLVCDHEKELSAEHRRQNSYDAEKSIRADRVLDKVSKLVLLGGPGSGKTTFLKSTGMRASEHRLKNNAIPIFISLREYSEENYSLTDYISELFSVCDTANIKEFIKIILRDGKCILLFDGLDEVNTENITETIKDIADFLYQFPNNRYIISCRTAAYLDFFNHFEVYEISDFNDDQIKYFVEHWYDDDHDKASLFLKQLEDPPIRELASTPLFLGMLCLLFEQSLEFPQNRAELYQEALDALLSKWDAMRLIKRSEIYRNLSKKRKEGFFSRLAVKTFQKGQIFFKHDDYVKEIEDYIGNLAGTRESEFEVDTNAVITAIEAQHGIVIKRTRKLYSFSHLSFHEYYASRYIINNVNERMLQNIISNYLFNRNWYEILLLTAGGLDEADFFFRLIKKELKNKIMHNKSVLFLLEKVYINARNADIKIPPPLFRCACLLIVLRKMIHDYDLLQKQSDKEMDSISPYFANAFYHPLKEIQSDLFWIYRGIHEALNLKQSTFIHECLSEETINEQNFKFNDNTMVIKVPKINPVIFNPVFYDRQAHSVFIDFIWGSRVLIKCLAIESYLRRDLWHELVDTLLVP